MGDTAISALARLTERRFQSFSEAADAVLDLLERQLPAAAIVLGQADWDESAYRVIDARGVPIEGVEPGATLALADSEGLLAPETLRDLDVRSYLAVPFDTSDGSGTVTLCSLARGAGVFGAEHLDLLAVSGRLLAYEWESVRQRADLLRLNEQLRDPRSTDPVTGLPNREAFVELLSDLHGTGIESYLVVCRARNLRAVSDRYGDAMAKLLLKDMADVIGGAIRGGDKAGRTGDAELSVLLAGCKGRAGAEAFRDRLVESLARVTSGRAARPELSWGIRELGASQSAVAALEVAEDEARGVVKA
jgi:GGDEF domain-containing protein